MTLHQRSARFAKPLIVWITLSTILSLVTLVFRQPAPAQILIAQVSLPPNIRQFLADFDLTPVDCGAGAASIQLEENTVCVQPSARIAAGSYVYDAATDQIKPLRNLPANPVVPPSPVQPRPGSTPANPTVATQSSYRFNFTNSFDYSNCLEDIMQLYKNQHFNPQTRRSSCLPEVFQANSRSLTQSQALDLIKAADAYATSAMSPAIYPPRGLRNRIAQEFGYTYALDINR
jgi:hypothetical protein